MSRSTLLTISLVGLCLASTVTNLGNRYSQDDMAVIEKNTLVHSVSEPWLFFTQSYWPKPYPPALYRPLATTGFATQWVLGGGRPWVFRVVSITMYAAAGLALFYLAGLLLPTAAAWLVAAFFMVHPVHVEAVAVAVNQSEIMVGLLSVLTVALYLGIRKGRRFGVGPAAALFGLYLTATLFKETGLMLIGLIVAAELTVVADQRPIRERIAAIRPMLLVMLLGAATFFAIRTLALEGDAVGTFTAEALDGLSIGGRSLTMLAVVPHWYRLLLWPAHLQGDYSPREIESATTWGTDQVLGLLLVGLAVIVAIANWRRRPVVTFGLLWVGIGIFPVSNILVPTGIALAERTLFLPSIGMMLVVGGLAAPVIERMKTHGAQVVGAIAVAAILVMGATRSASRQRVWKDQFTFWFQTTTDAPNSYRAHHALAQLLFLIGQKRWAEYEYKMAIALYPKQWGAYFELANKLRLNANCEPAVEYYRKTLQIEPEHEAARTSMIACLFYLARFPEARSESREGMAYATRPATVRVFQKLLRMSDSAAAAKAPPKTVRIIIAPQDTMP